MKHYYIKADANNEDKRMCESVISRVQDITPAGCRWSYYFDKDNFGTPIIVLELYYKGDLVYELDLCHDDPDSNEDITTQELKDYALEVIEGDMPDFDPEDYTAGNTYYAG